MLGNDFVNSSCPLGQGRLNKISLMRRVKDFTGPAGYVDRVILTNFKLLRGINFTSSKEYNLLVTDRGGIVDRSGSMFSPEPLDLEIYSLTELDYIKRFVRNNNYTLVLKLEFDKKTLFCDVIFTGDNINYFTVLDKWSIRLMRTSMYYTIKPYDFRNDYDSATDNVFRKTILNAGDIEADIQVFSSFLAYDNISITQTYDGNMYPNITVSEQNFNSLHIDIAEASINNVFLYSSVLNNYYIAELNPSEFGLRDVADKRSFSTKGFMSVAQGNTQISIDGFIPASNPDEYLEVYIYEYYYNI